MEISIITDEISYDFASAVELGAEWGCMDFEIRGAWLRRMPNAPPVFTDRILRVVKQYGVKIVGISPGIFKTRGNPDLNSTSAFIESAEEINYHKNTLVPASFDFAEKLGAKVIIVFGFVRPKDSTGGDLPASIVDHLGEIATMAEKRGFTLALETEHSTWVDSGEKARKVVDAVGSKALMINWDPSNIVAGISGEEAFTEGYKNAKGAIANVHVKDVARDKTTGISKWVLLGEGELDWKEHLKVLKRDGYDGYVAVEPHFQFQLGVKIIENCKKTYERLASYMSEVD